MIYLLERFKQNFDKYKRKKNLKDKLNKKIQYIEANPLQRMLKGSSKPFRHMHLQVEDTRFVIIYILCKECKTSDKFQCWECPICRQSGTVNDEDIVCYIFETHTDNYCYKLMTGLMNQIDPNCIENKRTEKKKSSAKRTKKKK